MKTRGRQESSDIELIKKKLKWAQSINEFNNFIEKNKSLILNIIENWISYNQINWVKIFIDLWLTQKNDQGYIDDIIYKLKDEKESIIASLILETFCEKKQLEYKNVKLIEFQKKSLKNSLLWSLSIDELEWYLITFESEITEIIKDAITENSIDMRKVLNELWFTSKNDKEVANDTDLKRLTKEKIDIIRKFAMNIFYEYTK